MIPVVFYCTIDPLQNATLFDRGTSLLPVEEQARIASRRRVDDRLRSLAGQMLLQAALDELHIPTNHRTVLRSETGRPYFADLPLRFSISHSGQVALCAVSDAPIGADVQTLHAPSDGLLRRVCTPEERAFTLRDNDLAFSFAALWTRKESLLKATGRTITADLREFSCLPGDGIELDGRNWRFFENTLFELPASVCVPAETDRIEWRIFDLNSKFF